MKLKKIFCVIFGFAFFNANAAFPMPFRIGFEFQVNGRLCEWALRDITLQKNPIITIKYPDIELGHIELDGPDIEFVTTPFSHEQKDALVLCMNAIKKILDLTQTELNSKNEISIEEWVGQLSNLGAGIVIEPNLLFEKIKSNKIKKPVLGVGWQPSWQPQITVQHPLQSTIELCNELFSDNQPMKQLIRQSMPTKMPPNTAISGLVFLVAHEMVGMTSSYLLPLNSNRILDLAMALAIYFDGRDITVPDLLKLSINALSDSRLQEIENHKLMRPCLAAVFERDEIKREELFKKLPMEDVFVKNFLVAATKLGTFIGIANNDQFMYNALLIRDTFEGFSAVYQFDAKRWTNFMSRRPFSHMLFEILKNKHPVISDTFSRNSLIKSSFIEIFNENILFADQLPNGFFLANYAEQFFDVSNKPIDLRILLPYFHTNIRDSIFLKSLLGNGILSTAMLRVIDIDRLKKDEVITSDTQTVIKNMFQPSYSTTVLTSIEKPYERAILCVSKEETLKIGTKKQEIIDDVPSDLLSPPFLLDSFDAMGRYKGLKHEAEKFGSAIIEFRSIQQAEQLKSQKNTFTQAGFLTIPDFVEEEALSIFELLSKLKLQPE